MARREAPTDEAPKGELVRVGERREFEVVAATPTLIVPPTTKVLVFRIVGDAPLVCNRWSEKAKKQMQDKQGGKSRGPREAKKPDEVFEAARHRLSDGSDGIPALALKKCAVAGARHIQGVTMTESRGTFFVMADDPATGLIRLIADEPTMRTDMVRNETGVADIRYRPEYFPWAADVRVLWDSKALTPEMLLSLFSSGGFHCGIGEWRPEKSGNTFGQFHVEGAPVQRERVA